MITDEYDAHGLSIFYFSLKGNFNYIDTSLLQSDIIAKKLETLSLASSLFTVDVAVVADLPIDMGNPEKVLNAYKKATASVGHLFFLDHHPTSKKFESDLLSIGVIPVLTSGVGMSVWLYKLRELFESEKEGDLLFSLTKAPKDEEAVAEALKRADDPLFRILLYGNFADMDYSASLLMMKSPEVGKELNEEAQMFDMLVRIERLGIARFAPNELVETVKMLADGVKKGKVMYPPAVYSKKVLKLATVRNGLLVYFFNHEIPSQWLNKTIAYILTTNDEIKYAVVASSGFDARVEREQTLICIYARWYDLSVNLTELTDQLARVLKEMTGLAWYNFGHKTFSCVATNIMMDKSKLKDVVQSILPIIERYLKNHLESSFSPP